MDLIGILTKKIQPGDTLDVGRKGLLCRGLNQLSKDGACSAFMIIKAYKENVDKSRSVGDNQMPYYSRQEDSKTDSSLVDISFEIDELPDQLLLLLEQLLKEK